LPLPERTQLPTIHFGGGIFVSYIYRGFIFLICFAFVFGLSTAAKASYIVKQELSTDGSMRILEVMSSTRNLTAARRLRALPSQIDEHSRSSTKMFEEWLYPDFGSMPALAKSWLLNESRHRTQEAPLDAELRKLVVQGQPENRINLTILGDGYTEAEREIFFEDAQRITDDLFLEDTFASYLPLFNVYAVFVASKDHGITDVESKDTVFGLYRSPKGSKRAIMPGNSSQIRKALKLAPATDFPIIIANDEYYGGLGGEFAITTRSVESGPMVLRHELGHNFGDVGEEYDGGDVYTGANHSSNKNVSWMPWVKGELRVFDVKILAQAYVWQKLLKNPFRQNIKFPAPDLNGFPYELDVDVSSVGWSASGEVRFTFDGENLPLEGRYTDDRSFFELNELNYPIPGNHQIDVEDLSEDGDNILAYLKVAALGHGYIKDKNFIGAYPTFNSSGRLVGYRPTHDSCLMRNMRSKHFCAIDRENMWKRFLDRVELVDRISYDTQTRKIRLETPALPALTIAWFRQTAPDEYERIESAENLSEWKVADKFAGHKLIARVQLETDEVRSPTLRFKREAGLTIPE